MTDRQSERPASVRFRRLLVFYDELAAPEIPVEVELDDALQFRKLAKHAESRSHPFGRRIVPIGPAGNACDLKRL